MYELTAKDALDLTKDALDDQADDVVAVMLNDIEEEANQGKTYAICSSRNFDINQKVLHKLIELGYEIDSMPSSESFKVYRVRWDDAT